MSNSEVPDLVGQIVDDRYKIESFLGKGAIGVVYKAEHILMKKSVALKMLHPTHTQEPELVQRFQQEAQAAANIEHLNICSATDFGQYDSQTYYLVMELLDGKSLDEIMKGGAISPKRAIHISMQILSALQEAHNVGVVHRDLKPENILIVDRGGDPDCVKITDFGIAQVRLTKDTQHLTQVGMVYGTPLYMSPEQAQGEEVDHRADLYSIGVMLYEMLVGRVPFSAASTKVLLSMHIFGPPQSFIEVSPGRKIDPKFEAIVMKLLEKDPADRFQNAIEVNNALAGLGEANEVPSRISNPDSTTIHSEKSLTNDGKVSRSSPKKDFALFAIPIVQALPVVVFGLFALVAGIYLNQDEKKVETAPPIFVASKIDSIKANRAAFLKIENLESLETRVSTESRSAITELRLFIKKTPDASHLHFLLGKALLKRKNYKESIASFENATVLNPAYIKDSALLDHIFAIFELRRTSDAKYAYAFILSSIRENGSIRLAEIAEHHQVEKVRKRALELLNESGLFTNLEKWNQLTISLRHVATCAESRTLITEIIDLGKPKTLGALWRFSSNPKTGCKGKDCWQCVRSDLRAGIKKLNGM